MRTFIRKRNFIIVICLFAATAQSCKATSYYFPKFGTPIVSDHHIVFAGAGLQSDRLICISRSKGEKLWEVEDKGHILKPWFIMDEKLVVTKDSDIYQCDFSSGDLKLMYKSGFTKCGLEYLESMHVLLRGEKDDVDFLCCVDLKQSKELWRVSGVHSTIARSPKILCVQKATRKKTSVDTYTLTDVQICGLRVDDGKICWTQKDSYNSLFPEGVTRKEYFVVELSGAVKCYRQKDGTVLNSIIFGRTRGVSICPYKSDVLAWIQVHFKVPPVDKFSYDESLFKKLNRHVIYSLSVPELEKREVFKPDWFASTARTYDDIIIGNTVGKIFAYDITTGKKIWEGGQWNWSGIHDSYIYYSKHEHNGDSTTINQINVTTGERKKLYEELLP